MAARLKGPRAWIAGLVAVLVLLPGLGHAQAGVRECRLLDGGDTVTFQIPPSVSFELGQQPIDGSILYISKAYTFRYRCLNNAVVPKRAAIVILGDYAPIREALRKASLSLSIVYESLFLGQWSPDPLEPTYSPYFSVGDPYQGDSGERIGRIFLVLLMNRPITKPLRSFLPATFAFKLVADEGAVMAPGIFLNTTPSRFQYIPSCIGSVSVDNTVTFDTVLTTASYNGKLPQAKPFNLTARINSPAACPGMEPLIGPSASNNALDAFFLRTVVSFLPQSGERTDKFKETLFLKNADGQENGLQLTITNAANQTVKFGTLPMDQYGLTLPDYAGNVGPTLQGTTLSQIQTYTAHLERTGAELKTGTYSAQVLVKVTWY